MTRIAPDLLEAQRLPALWRGVCLYAGLPLPPATAWRERFIIRCGDESPELLAHLLAEGLVEDGVEVHTGQQTEEPATPSGCFARVVVCSGYPAPCPDADELGRAVAADGAPVLLFAVERRDTAGRLLGVTWAAVPEEEPPSRESLRAAVRSYEYDPPLEPAAVPR